MQLNSLKLKGAFFEDETNLNIFPCEKETNIAIIYGKNGSGKSSIARAINEYKENMFGNYSIVKWMNRNSTEIDLNSDERKRIYVYNEDFIEKNVRIDSEGLKSIIMFGKQISIDEKIKEKKEELILSERNLEKIKTECFEDEKDIKSPQFHFNKIINILKNNKWAANDSKIKNNKNKSAVKEDTVEEIVKNKPIETKENIESKFNNLLTVYENISQNNGKIEKVVKKIHHKVDVENKIIELLAKKVNEPVVNDREKAILKIIENNGQKNIEYIKEMFEKGDVKFCPYCFQKVSDNYKMDLINSINKVINKEVEEHKQELETLKLDIVNFEEYKEFEILDKEQNVKLMQQITEHNKLVQEYIGEITEKTEKIFTPIVIENKGLKDSYLKLNGILDTIENKRVEFNKNIDNIKKIKLQLLELNKQLAWYDIKDEYEIYLKQKKEKELAIQSKIKTQENIYEIKKNILSLTAQKSNIKIALDKINRNLEYIFFSKDRLKLELKNGKYCIKSKGKNIKLKNLSIGERNIISLCYFFLYISDNCDESDEFCNDCLIVLDDPISSFDFENKVGIYSFLRTMFSKIINKNNNSKILVLTHELEVVFNMEKVAKDIEKKYCLKKLEQRTIKDFGRNKNDYGLLLEQVYKFANKEAGYEELDLTIGNIMRRVVEAFSTFMYKTGIAEISCDKEILGNIDSQEQKNYFENLMYRLVLHGESHLEERACSVTETSFFEYISIEEKIKTAKDILAFLYLLNSSHIKAYFKYQPNAIDNIEQWSKNNYL